MRTLQEYPHKTVKHGKTISKLVFLHHYKTNLPSRFRFEVLQKTAKLAPVSIITDQKQISGRVLGIFSVQKSAGNYRQSDPSDLAQPQSDLFFLRRRIF